MFIRLSLWISWRAIIRQFIIIPVLFPSWKIKPPARAIKHKSLVVKNNMTFMHREDTEIHLRKNYAQLCAVFRDAWKYIGINPAVPKQSGKEQISLGPEQSYTPFYTRTFYYPHSHNSGPCHTIHCRGPLYHLHLWDLPFSFNQNDRSMALTENTSPSSVSRNHCFHTVFKMSNGS